MEKLHDALFGDAVPAADLDEEVLLNKRCDVIDEDGNRLPIPLRQVWEAVQEYFDVTAEKPWLVTEGTITMQRPGEDQQKDQSLTKRKRNVADPLQKVCHSESLPEL